MDDATSCGNPLGVSSHHAKTCVPCRPMASRLHLWWPGTATRHGYDESRLMDRLARPGGATLRRHCSLHVELRRTRDELRVASRSRPRLPERARSTEWPRP